MYTINLGCGDILRSVVTKKRGLFYSRVLFILQSLSPDRVKEAFFCLDGCYDRWVELFLDKLCLTDPSGLTKELCIHYSTLSP